MSEEKAIKNLSEMKDELRLEQKENIKVHKYNPEIEIESIDVVLNLVEKKDKIIYELAKAIYLEMPVEWYFDNYKRLKGKSPEEYQYILDNIDRKISHMKDEHKIRGVYAEFGVKRGRLEVLQELLEGK